MKCPRTGSPLKSIKVGKIAVDVSEECGGVFFDNSELEQFDEQHEIRGEVLVEHLSPFENVILAADHRLHCPKCANVVMMRRLYNSTKYLEIDECPNCRGIWLDGGELRTLRDSFVSAHERVALCDRLMAEVLKDPEVRKQQFDDANTLQRLETFADILHRLVLKRFDI